ncbi:hypothetical protein BKA63DRAFT_282061 [Paraphoma chrysanthemicola]|nr:hypothetical protein BKA63DRAFT_282061 [Paraphoma chrysanthemicola]
MAHRITSAPRVQNMCNATMLDTLSLHSLVQAKAEAVPNMHASTRRYYPTIWRSQKRRSPLSYHVGTLNCMSRPAATSDMHDAQSFLRSALRQMSISMHWSLDMHAISAVPATDDAQGNREFKPSAHVAGSPLPGSRNCRDAMMYELEYTQWSLRVKLGNLKHRNIEAWIISCPRDEVCHEWIPLPNCTQQTRIEKRADENAVPLPKQECGKRGHIFRTATSMLR